MPAWLPGAILVLFIFICIIRTFIKGMPEETKGKAGDGGAGSGGGGYGA